MAGSIQGTEFFISGLDMHEEELEREYWEKSKSGEKNVAVLFPSEDSLTVRILFFLLTHNSLKNILKIKMWTSSR